MTVRLLTDADAPAAWRLSQLAFGWRGEPEQTLLGRTVLGVDGAAGLAAMARLRDYEQFWGGRRVRMSGVASVAVAPDARGKGAAADLMRGLVREMREADRPISVLFPTTVGLYRRVGWEVVGTLDETDLPTSLLTSAPRADAEIRTMTATEVGVVAEVYERWCGSVDGLLARDGREFPKGPQGLVEYDVVAIAQGPDGPSGYASYHRGPGYGASSRLDLGELVALSADAAAALVRSLASWESVAPTVRWRGPTTELAWLLPKPVPPPRASQPWMLRIVDAPAAVAARGLAADADEAFALVDPEVPEHARGWRLVGENGSGRLEPTDGKGLPQLHVRGLALLYAGVDSASVVRAGLLDRPLPGLDRAFGGQRPRILDYF